MLSVHLVIMTVFDSTSDSWNEGRRNDIMCDFAEWEGGRKGAKENKAFLSRICFGCMSDI